MKNILAFAMPLLFLGMALKAPVKPESKTGTVQWGYSCNKITTKSPKDAYEVRIRAKIDDPWHMFSQTTKGIGLPTEFAFNKNPLLSFKDTLAEKGEMITEQTDISDEPEKYFEKEVTFVDTVYVTPNVKTNFAGSVQYMLCKEGQCLNPTTEKFDVKLKNGWKLNW